MKKIFFLITTLFILSETYAQTTAQFKESQYLKLDTITGFYLTVLGDTTVRLKVRIKDGLKYETTGITINNGDTITHQSKSIRYKYNDFKSEDFSLNKQDRLYGDFVQDKKTIKFYPWKFNKDTVTQKKLSKYDYYTIEIPKRTVVRTKYSAWHYGALTLPVKFYSKNVDSLSNTQFGANLNLMIGRKWGRKKYSYLAEKASTPYTIAKSINLITGIGELTLNSSNTDNKLTKEIKVASLSYGLAFGFQYKKIGLFIASGFDTPLSRYGKDWVYKESLWLGFGIGLGL